VKRYQWWSTNTEVGVTKIRIHDRVEKPTAMARRPSYQPQQSNLKESQGAVGLNNDYIGVYGIGDAKLLVCSNLYYVSTLFILFM